MNTFKIACLIAAFTLPLSVFADSYEYEDSTGFSSSTMEYTPFQPYIKGGANLISASGNTLANNKMQFLLGAGSDYFFDPNWGLFLQAEFNQRGRTILGSSVSSASFIDVPFGAAYQYGKGLWGANSQSTLRLGSYAALPISDFKYDVQNSDNQSRKAKAYAGFYAENDFMFKAGSSLVPGISMWVKLPFSSAVTEATVRYYEVGIGLKLGLF